MCGIVAYNGTNNSLKFLINGLSSLEYRGYDSCGIAGIKDRKIDIIKTVGRVKNLEEKSEELLNSNIGIGHTRWATHGKVTAENSHPHTSENGRFTLVHNGVIENYLELKDDFLSETKFVSQTDTEVIVQLVQKFSDQGLETKEAFRQAVSNLQGSYALCMLDSLDENVIYFAKNKSPLLIGVGESENYLGSDALAMIKYTNNFIEIKDGEFGQIYKDKIVLEDKLGNSIDRDSFTTNIKFEELDKGLYPHFMIKEINEQDSIVRKLVNIYFEDEKIKINQDILDSILESDRLYIIACGTSYNAGLIGKEYFEKWAKIPTEIHLASEFAYNLPLLSEKPMFIFISQSGETADIRSVLTKAKKDHSDIKTLVITNVEASTLSRESDYTLLIHAGAEIAVASTKAYTAQVVLLSILAYKLSQVRNQELSFNLKHELSLVANVIESVLNDQERIKEITQETFIKRNAFYIGRGIDYYSCLEAALKLKEISYIQTEGFAGGELKHGTIALIEEDTPVVAFITNSKLELNTRSNLAEVASRGAKILAICLEKFAKDGDYAIPNVYEDLGPIVTIIVAQLISYFAALYRDLDVDKPRNLAKSVTVE